MLAQNFKRTKIVATIGPASESEDVLRRVIQSGANAVRLNFSHGTHQWHLSVIRRVRQISKDLGKPVAIIQDLQGPRIRAGVLPDEGINLTRGQKIRLGYERDYYKDGVVPVQYDISRLVKKGESIFLRDGLIKAVVEKVQDGVINAEVESPGILTSNQGINLPDADMQGEIITSKDLKDIDFGIANGVDFIALSFVQRPEDVLHLKKLLKRKDADIHVISKIETKAAINCLEDITEVSDGVMVARGDLAVELAPEAVPVIQEQSVQLAKKHKKFVIIATQMLESMVNAPQPTRAEVSDVARAVLEQADAVMLSGETAKGNYPAETVAMMKRIITHTEQNRAAAWQEPEAERSAENAISKAAIKLAEEVEAKVIIAETASGQTARNLSSLRPGVPIIMVTHDERVYHKLALRWGGRTYLIKNAKGAGAKVMRTLREDHNVAKGDPIVIASGNNPGVPGGTNMLTLVTAP